MKKNKNTRIVVFTLLMLGVVVWLFFLQKKKYTDAIAMWQASDKRQVHTIETIKNNQLLIYSQHDNTSLAQGVFLDAENEVVPHEALVEKLPLLILRFSTHGCDSCIASQLAIMENIEQDLLSNMMILLSFDNVREKKLYLQDKNYKCQFLEYRDDSMTLGSMDNILFPYYFVLNKDLTISKIFIPVLGFDEYTRQYWSMTSSHINVLRNPELYPEHIHNENCGHIH